MEGFFDVTGVSVVGTFVVANDVVFDIGMTVLLGFTELDLGVVDEANCFRNDDEILGVKVPGVGGIAELGEGLTIEILGRSVPASRRTMS